jgi:hypothetical protein
VGEVIGRWSAIQDELCTGTEIFIEWFCCDV